MRMDYQKWLAQLSHFCMLPMLRNYDIQDVIYIMLLQTFEFTYILITPYGPGGSNMPWFICWFCVFVCFLLTFLPSFLSFLLILLFLVIYFFTHLLPDLPMYFFQNRPVLFPGRRSQEATKPGFCFLGLFYVILLWISFVVLDLVFQY